jgi:phage head maturation protease
MKKKLWWSGAAKRGERVFCRAAWDGIEKLPSRVKANRDHDKTRTVGKIVNFWPSRKEGLVGAARIAQTPLGDETLALADEDCLGASVGFAVSNSGMELDRRNRKRRIKKAFMDHLAFVHPAYVGAGVLSVRGAAVSATPSLDELVAWMQGRNQNVRFGNRL